MRITGSLLKKTGQDGLKLMNMIHYLLKNEDKSTIQELQIKFIKSLRKISLAEIFSNKRIICVSGLQGAGKSTLIQNVYNTNNVKNFQLRTNLGRGEKFPIFITEHDIDEVEYLRNYYDLDHEEVMLKTEVLDYEKFEQIASDGDINTVLLEVHVPYEYLRDDGKSGFLLLPGFEERKKVYFESDEEIYWKALVDFCTACADTNIFITPFNLFASNEIKMIKEKIRDFDLIKNSIFVISKSEGMSSEQKKETADHCKDIFGLGSAKVDDFIFTTDSPAYKNNWVNQLLQKIYEHRNDVDTLNSRRNRYLKKVVYDDLREILSECDNIVSRLASCSGLENSKIEGYDRIIDKEYRRIKKIYKKELLVVMQNQKEYSIDCLDELMPDEKLLKRVRRAILGNSVKDVQDYKKMIKKTLINSRDKKNYSCIAYANVQALAKTSEKLSEFINKQYLNDTSGNNSNTALGKGQQALLTLEAGQKIQFSKAMINDIRVLYCEQEGKLVRDNLNDTLKTLVDFVFWNYQRQIVVGCDLNANVLTNYEDEGSGKLNIPSFKEQMANYKGNITAAAGVLGISIDAAADGKIDIISAIGDIFGVSEAFVLSTIAVGGLAYCALNFLKGLNQKQITEYLYNVELINNIYAEAEQELLNKSDELMEDLKDQLLDRLKRIVGEGQGSSDLINVRRYLKNLEGDIREMNDKIGDNELLPC